MTNEHAAVRLCVAADIERYSRFTNCAAARAQARFTEILRYALGPSEAHVQQLGDGQFLVLPPGLDESVAIPAFLTGLSIALRRTNADLNTHARLRLRVAMHRGLLRPSPNGWVGNSVIAVHRLLDSPSLRAALAGAPAADFALAVGDTLYQDVIAHDYPGLPPEMFGETMISIPGKGFSEQAWIYIANGLSR